MIPEPIPSDAELKRMRRKLLWRLAYMFADVAATLILIVLFAVSAYNDDYELSTWCGVFLLLLRTNWSDFGFEIKK